MQISHIAVWTKDIEVVRSFYIKYFGASSSEKYINKEKEFESYFLNFSSGPKLELMKMISIPETKNDPVRQFTGLIHIAISVGSKEKVDSLTDELRANGYRILDGPRKTGDGFYESVVLDPEDNRIEITV